MQIPHRQAKLLEQLACSIYKTKSGGFGGYIDADIFEKDPIMAAVICLAPSYYSKQNDADLDYFFTRYCDCEEFDVNDFVRDLSALVE